MSLLPPPASKERQQWLVLAALLVVLAAVGWWLYWPASTPSAPAPAPQAASTEESGELPVPGAVQLGALDTTTDLDDAGRNPFSYGVRPPPPPPPRTVAPPAVPVNLPPPPPQGPPPIGLRLIGLTKLPADGRTLATLKDPALDVVFSGFEGDVLDGRYRIVKVGVESVTVSYVDGSGSRTIGLGG